MQTRITHEHREAEYSAEKDFQSMKKFHSFCETSKFFTVLTIAHLKRESAETRHNQITFP